MTKLAWISKYPSIWYLVISFAFSWALFLPYVYVENALESDFFLIARILSSFGPALAAVVLIRLTEGKNAVKKLFRDILSISSNQKWMAVAAGLAFLAVLIPLAVLVYMHEISLASVTARNLLILIPNFVLSLLLFGSITDEIGWRGFLLAKLQQNHTAVSASVIIGLFWGLWQLPTYYFSGLVESNLSPIWLFIESVALSIILTWIYNSSKSLVGSIVFNGVYRTLTQFFLPLSEATGNIVAFQQLYTGVLVNIALIVLLFCGGKKLVFSFQPRKSEER
ncbi:MAG TPA: CPBP family intramembrane metalloprotease [Firmicutes bacterium]|nr:CPBP family intramembrane metalloprotease [Bacillota bacterium]